MRSDRAGLSAALVAALACTIGCTIGCGDDDAAAPDASIPERDGGAVERDAGPPPIEGTTYHVELDGDDTADGSEGTPWATIPRGLGALEPGDTLLIGDGDWPAFRIDCVAMRTGCGGEPCVSGLPNGRITVRAKNERRARVRHSNADTAVIVDSCDYWTVEGLVLSQGDNSGNAMVFEPVLLASASDHLIVRRNVLREPNRWSNNHMIWVIEVDHILIEENEIYDFHREGIVVNASVQPVVRRNYVNSRGTENITDPAAFSCCCTSGGDDAIVLEATFAGVVENNVMEDLCTGVVVRGEDGTNDGPEVLATKANRVIGNVALSIDGSAFEVNSYCGETPCELEDRADDNELIDSVAVDVVRAVNLDASRRTVIRNLTSIDASSADFRMWLSTRNESVSDASFVVVNALDVGAGTGIGYLIQNHPEWQIVSSNSFGNETDFSRDSENAVMHTTIDPELGACRVYVPDGSPMRGAGVAGADIGANVIYRSVNGRLTGEPLWDPETGAFPCGAVVPGVNDEATLPGASCATVHERLNVGANGCPVPPLR